MAGIFTDGPRILLRVVRPGRARDSRGSMERTASIIAIGYGALVVLGLVGAVLVWRATRRPAGEDADTTALAERETTWLWIVLALLAALLLATIFFTPYGESAPSGGQVVEVTGSQFAWQLAPGTVRAGEPVEFRVTAADVNHGLGVYNEAGRLVFQVQAMPGEEIRTAHTFERPGTYTVLCLEFCGVGHHVMETAIEVTG